jgi:hypothetical protein
LKAFQAGGHGKFYMDGWRQAGQQAQWDIQAPAADDYAVNVLLKRQGSGAIRLEVTAGDRSVSGTVPADVTGWTRQSLDETLHLSRGLQTTTLRLAPAQGSEDFAAQVMSVELARALGQRGIKLILYYHLGAVSDPEWLKACSFWETDTRPFFRNWQAVISEVGRRYGSRLAGWWFDDGSVNYYYRSAPWEQLTRAARAGYPRWVVGCMDLTVTHRVPGFLLR